MKGDEGKVKANSISGIPMPGTITQVEGKTVEPNRHEPEHPFRTDGTGEIYARDYFDHESERLGNLEGDYVAEKGDKNLSLGLHDEENTDANALDSDGNEGLLPETLSLPFDSGTRFGDDQDADLTPRPLDLDSNLV